MAGRCSTIVSSIDPPHRSIGMARTFRYYMVAGFLFFGFVANLSAQPASNRPIELSVDASEAPRRLLHATMKIPVNPGPLTLYYPKWIQGEHSPNGPINDLSGLKLKAGGKSLSWRRDDLDLFAFHCVIPAGVDTLEVSLDYLGAAKDAGSGLGSSAPCM